MDLLENMRANIEIVSACVRERERKEKEQKEIDNDRYIVWVHVKCIYKER